MLTRWLLIDATREGAIVVHFHGGFELVVYEHVAELVRGAMLIAVLPIAQA